jgi:hypothetical protein
MEADSLMSSLQKHICGVGGFHYFRNTPAPQQSGDHAALVAKGYFISFTIFGRPPSRNIFFESTCAINFFLPVPPHHNIKSENLS